MVETRDVGAVVVSGNAEDVVSGGNDNNTQRTRKGRGKNVIRWGDGCVRERVKWGKTGAPLWPRKKCAEFSAYIGRLAADGETYPITVKDWRYFTDEVHHRRAWQRVKDTIEWSDEDTAAKKGAIKRYVFERLNDRWKQHKRYLKQTFWEPNQGSDQRFHCGDKSVDETQWLDYVKYLDGEDAKTKAAINVSNRTHRVMHHSTGTRTFQAVIHQWKVENAVEGEVDRWEIFKLTHRKKGSKEEYVDAASAKAVLDFEKAEEERRKANVAITPAIREDIYAEVLGVEKRNKVRGLGAGVKWSDVPYVHTEKKRVSRTVSALEAIIEQQRLQAEKDRVEAAEREERIRAEAVEREKSYVSEMEKFMSQQRLMMEEKMKMVEQKTVEQRLLMEENAKMVVQKAVEQMGEWMKGAVFSGNNVPK